MSEQKPSTGLAPDKIQILEELDRRGALTPERKQLFLEWKSRQAPGAAPQPTAAPSPPGAGVPDPLGAAATAAGNLASSVHQRIEGQNDRFPDVDYSTGLGTSIESGFKMQDSDAERQAFLERAYGKGNVFRDPGQRFFVHTPEGKDVAVAGGIVPSVIGAGPELVGGTIGAVAGGPVGAAVGTAAGKAAQEFAKILGGTQRKTAGEEALSIGMSGIAGGVGQKAGELVTGLPAAAGRFFRSHIAAVTPESRDMAAGVARIGGFPTIRSAAPGLTSPVQKQYIAAKLGYDPIFDRNKVVVQNRIREIVESQMNPAESQRALEEILDSTSAVSSLESGEAVTAGVRQRIAGMEGDVKKLITERDRSLDTQFKNLEFRMRQPGPLGQDVAASLADARKQFSDTMQLEYGPIRQIVGDNPVVPTGVIQKAAKALLESMPKTRPTVTQPAQSVLSSPVPGTPFTQAPAQVQAGRPIFEDPKVLDSVTKLTQLDPKIRFGDAQQIRSQLGDWALSPDLASSLPKHQFEQLRQAVDHAFDVAKTDPAVAPAVDALRRADAKYAEGIKKFQNLAINQITKDLRDGIVPNPTYVADRVLQPGQLQQAQTVKKMVGPDLWERIAGADWESLLSAARDPQTGEISSRKLASEIAVRDKDGLLDLTYGSRARDMRLYVQRLASRDEKIPAGTLQPGSFGNTMRLLERKQAELDKYLGENYLSALAKPGRDQDSAVKWIVRPASEGGESRLMKAEKEFGAASSIMRSIRTQWLKEVLNSAIAPAKAGVGEIVSGEGISDALKPYTRRQLSILAPDGLADDMKYLARQINAMFPTREEQMAGSLIAGQIKNLPLFGVNPLRYTPLTRGPKGGRIYQTLKYDLWAWIYSRPTTVRVLSEGLRSGAGKDATRETIRGLARAAALGMLPSADENPVQDPGVNPRPGSPLRMPPRKVGDRGPQGGIVTGIEQAPSP